MNRSKKKNVALIKERGKDDSGNMKVLVSALNISELLRTDNGEMVGILRNNNNNNGKEKGTAASDSLHSYNSVLTDEKKHTNYK